MPQKSDDNMADTNSNQLALAMVNRLVKNECKSIYKLNLIYSLNQLSITVIH